jgi:hypothetical protein
MDREMVKHLLVNLTLAATLAAGINTVDAFSQPRPELYNCVSGGTGGRYVVVGWTHCRNYSWGGRRVRVFYETTRTGAIHSATGRCIYSTSQTSTRYIYRTTATGWLRFIHAYSERC